MEITLKKKEDENNEDENNELPPKDEDIKTPSIEEEKRRLELENAEMKGRLSALKEQPRPQPTNTHEQTKQRVYADAAGMDDENFQKVYGMSKDQAKLTIVEREAAMSRTESRRAMAEAEAKTEMATKYGTDFYLYKGQVEDAVADLSEEVRSDPSRLSKAVERIYLGLRKDSKAPSKEDPRKKIVSDFSPPTPSIDAEKKPDAKEIPEAYKPLSKVFGIKDETERQELMKTIKEGEYVPMNMGGGIWFKHPDRGFERVESKA